MSSYGDSFDIVGFENIVRDGYFESPSGGLAQGSTVEYDSAGTLAGSQGVLKVAGAAAVLGGAGTGFAVYEHLMNEGAYNANPANQAIPEGARVVVVRGGGVKVKCVTAATGAAVGNGVVPDASGGVSDTGVAFAAGDWGVVERVVNVDAGGDTVVVRLAA